MNQRRMLVGLVCLVLVGVGVPVAWAASSSNDQGASKETQKVVQKVDVAAKFLTPEAEREQKQSACTSLEEPAGFKHFSVGSELGGLSLSSVLRYCADSDPSSMVPNYVSLMYGDCEPGQDKNGLADGGCALPLEIQTWPLCLRNPSLYSEKQGAGSAPEYTTEIRGVPVSVFENGLRAEVQTGAENVVVFATEKGLVREAVEKLVPSTSLESPAETARALTETESENTQPSESLEQPDHDYFNDMKGSSTCG